jgi:hypothetical protein
VKNGVLRCVRGKVPAWLKRQPSDIGDLKSD